MAERTVLSGVTLIDGTGSAPRPGMSVVIDGSVITEVCPADRTVTAPQDRVYDLPGTTLLPGLIDCHRHLRSNAGARQQDVHLWNMLTSVEEQTLHAAANARAALRSGFNHGP
ncbi:hypothetical protein [Streptomyces sp. NPDC056683]|uniref:hypothetical protein n=1 Tax=Streptomyces sp. NPDC056683 TaxID=3345910 RepID=UPI003689C3DA